MTAISMQATSQLTVGFTGDSSDLDTFVDDQECGVLVKNQ